ncbi:MAG: hypothetical protein FWG11_03875, partial [Promicromonosporaceae bacterium]|nr:hypothetical protein [Promicromonosporaceae bacterium]
AWSGPGLANPAWRFNFEAGGTGTRETTDSDMTWEFVGGQLHIGTAVFVERWYATIDGDVLTLVSAQVDGLYYTYQRIN